MASLSRALVVLVVLGLGCSSGTGGQTTSTGGSSGSIGTAASSTGARTTAGGPPGTSTTTAGPSGTSTAASTTASGGHRTSSTSASGTSGRADTTTGPSTASGTTGIGATTGGLTTTGGVSTTGAADGGAPQTSLHYAAGNSDGSDGFNLADVSSLGGVQALPAGVSALVWLGLCNGADSTFTATVQPFIGVSQVFGFYLMDEPDPTGQYAPLCPIANLKAESDWIHTNDPGAKTFIVLMNLGSSPAPSYTGTYNPSNTGIDLYGLDPYPCRTDVDGGCDFDMVSASIPAAEADGIPVSAMVPVYQTFGGGSYVDDTGGAYQMPTVTQEESLMALWASLTPAPAFDYAYAWGQQDGDDSLSADTALQALFAAHNQ